MLTRLVNLRPALLLVALPCLLASSSAYAAAPATVTVRVEGLTETKVPTTLVTTTATPVIAAGEPATNACPGNSALGALNTASSGKWSGTWYGGESKGETFKGLGYSIESIDGESHLFEKGSNANYFWSFWFNDKPEEEHGLCEVAMETGDRVLMFVECSGSACPPNPTPLEIEAPAAANVGEEVPVAVKQYNTKGEAAPAVGASVEGGGTTATTDSQGHATLTFTSAGSYTLKVNDASSGPPAVRTETTICLHAGNDGTCGTTAPSKSESPGQSPPAVSPPSIAQAITAQIEDLREGHTYSRRHAPRTLAGKIDSAVAVTSISIRLRRSYKGRCWIYNGTLERLQHTRCGHGGFFKINSQGSSFSYLLPSKLPPGRYVFEVEATNVSGQHTELKLDSSKITFRVG